MRTGRMNNKYTTSFAIKNDYPFEKEEVAKQKALLVYDIVKDFSYDVWYTLKISKREYKPQHFDEHKQIEIHVQVGKITPTYLEWKPSPKLSFCQRLRVLFSGKYPEEIVRHE